MEKERLTYADYAKAIAIGLVVLGHTNGAYVPGKSWLYQDLCYAFHMPLFFILSGFFICPKEKYGKDVFLKTCNKNFFSLILPFFLWGIIYMPFSYTNIARLAYGSWLQLRAIGTLTSLWFLPVLCLSRFFCHTAYGIAWKHHFSFQKTGWRAVPVLFAIGFCLPHWNDVQHGVGTWWGVDIAFVAAGFVMTGSLCRAYFDRLAKSPLWLSAGLSLVFTAIFLAGFFIERPMLTAGVNMTMLMANAEYGPVGFCLLNAFAGSFAAIFFAIVLSHIVPKNATLLFVGANTMGIYLLHKNIIFGLTPEFAKLRIVPDSVLPALLIAATAFMLSLLLMLVFLKFAPWVFGKTFGPQSQLSLKEALKGVFAHTEEDDAR